MAAVDVKCEKCGSPAIPKRVEIVANPTMPSRIVDLILVVYCRKCGWQKQPAPMDPVPGDPCDARESSDVS